jgi:hypothetical protein
LWVWCPHRAVALKVGPGLRACVEGCLAARVRWMVALAWGAGGLLLGCV